jgi:predicted MFS family arabinose efflux permease
MNVSLVIVSIAGLVCALATTFELLVAMRIAAGALAGGIFPIAMALIGDLMPVEKRQVAIGQLLAVGLTGNVLGASLAGVIGDLFGWRGVFGVISLFGLVTAIAAFFAFRGFVRPKPKPFNRAAVLANFRGIFADPRAKVCFTSVFFEAIFVHGLFPFVALLLIGIGQPSAAVAGLLIGCFALGGVVYSVSVPLLVTRITEPRLMILGGAFSAAGLTLIALQFSWVSQIGLFALFGFGFYLLHSCIQVHVTDLSQTARGAAMSLHSTFFFLGQAIGPVIYGYGFAHGGMETTMFVGAAVLMTIGLICSRLLRHRGASV